MGRRLELDELVEFFTLLPDETALLRNKSGATRLGFALLLKFLHPRAAGSRAGGPSCRTRRWSSSPGRSGCQRRAGLLRLGRAHVKAHRAQIRAYLGFRECSVARRREADRVAGRECRAGRAARRAGAGGAAGALPRASGSSRRRRAASTGSSRVGAAPGRADAVHPGHRSPGPGRRWRGCETLVAVATDDDEPTRTSRRCWP